MVLLYFLLILIFPFIIFLNILVYRLVVRKALRKHIKPKLEEKGLTFIDYKWPGLFSNGGFGNPEITLLVNTNGNLLNSIYVYIYFKDAYETKKTTARIDTMFLFIRKVTYSSEL